jgi:perosamine synthetase
MNFFNTYISPAAIERAASVLKSGWVSEGCMVKKFETELSEKIGLLYPVAVNSGTSALHLALVLSGIEPGDEVILPAQTFVATGLVILMQGAKPVFADINPTTGNISPVSIREKITEHTKAIMPVHWGGYPCDMDEINALGQEYGLTVIEDAAHAFGATYRGRPIGSLSRFTAFSFQAIKHLTTGDGGALCCSRKEDAEAAFVKRWFGIDRVNSNPSLLGEREYDIKSIGYKYHMNDIAAAVGLGNLQDFSKNLARRQEIGAYYREQLSNVAGLELLRHDADRTNAYWLFTILVESREDFIRKLASRGIPTSVVHLRIDGNSVFGGEKAYLPGQQSFNRKQISVPLHNALSDEDIDTVVCAIREGW